MWDLRMPALHPLYTTQSRQGNVMCCFSPDDQYILSSAVDNEVRQHLVSDGRLHLAFDLAPTGSTHNYTRRSANRSGAGSSCHQLGILVH